MFENGLTWVKADFHLHTHKDKEFKYSGEENSFVKEYIAQLKSESVSVGVITNHNKFDEGEYKALKKSGRKEGILILPGVELSVKEANGIHTLIVFNPDEWIVNGENFIAHFLIEAFAGISNAENRNTRCKFDLRDVIEALDSYGKDYFIVFAHVDQGSGLMQECSGGLLQLLDHLVGNKIGNFSQELEGFHAEIEDAIKQLLDVEAIPTEIEDLNTQKSNYEHHLRIFEERGVADKLKKQTGYGLDRQKINDVKSDISRDITAIKTMIAGIVTRNDALNGYTSEYNAELIEEAISVLGSISTQIDSIKSSLVKLESLRDDLASILTKLDDKMELLKGEFAEIKRQIGDTELDVDAYPQLKANLESVKTKIEDLFKKMGSQETIKNNLRASMRKRNELLACEFSAYESEVKAINESQPELSVELTFKGDKDSFRELLKNAFRGSNLKDAKRQMLSENFTDFLALVDDIILDDGKKCKAILSENEFGKVKEKILSQYGELIRKLTPNKVEIKYHGKLLKQHSLGQRASALVLFILTKSENDVIIIDQPEDDLDNKVIYDEVIKAIRDKKMDIQFLFATHNANIPVLGDAEKIVAAEYSEGKILPIQGNIDSPATHKLIVDIMEGGQEAFERRQMIYTAWN